MSYRKISSALLCAAMLVAPGVHAAGSLDRCESHLSENKQPDFTSTVFNSLDAIQKTSDVPAKLRLATNTTALNPETGIFFPFDQDVSISYVYESAGASHSLGWAYYDDLVAAGYINQNGTPTNSTDDTLVDSDGNGIADLHDDIYNTSYTRPYVGLTRRCSNTFSQSGKTYYEPDLAKNGCGSTWNSGSSTVGNSGANSGDTGWSDNGLHPRIPNILEPKHALNNNRGLGKLLYLLGDDDTDTSVHANLPPVADGNNQSDGVPDYDVSAFDSSGKPVAASANPDNGIHVYDRTISMGTVRGNREIVFFLVVYYGGTSCLKTNSAGTSCSLNLNTPISVFWSKSFLNMDLNTGGSANPVKTVDIGCDYTGANHCNQTGTNLDGWLDTPTITRLNTAAYGNLVLPHEKVNVTRPATGKMPHTIVGAPSTDPLVWILGFEDLNSGGDKDFNDIVFMINKKNNGGVRSGVVSGDISPTDADDFTITNVRFKRDDDTTRQSFYTVAPHTTACSKTPLPSISYELAVDCNLCTLDTVTGVTTCSPNPSPSWTPVVFPNTTPPTQEVIVDMTKLGFTGSQLCWRAIIDSPDEFCQPTINKVEVGYQAIKAGSYSRAAVSPLGNAVVYGGFEVLGKSTTPAPSIKSYDLHKDLSVRGHLYFKTLYDPNNPSVSSITQQWDAGQKLSIANFDARKLYSLGTTNGSRIALSDDLALGDNSAIFPINATENYCKNTYVDIDGPVNDLNRDGSCDATDRTFIYNWVMGWEDKTRAANVLTGPRRAWPMGQINLSTAAVIGPPSYPTWWTSRSDLVDKEAYRLNFRSALASRPTMAYVGTATGMLHAFNAGAYREGDNSCTTPAEYRGYFLQSPCAASPNYGTGVEGFSYLPRSALGLWVNSYTSRTKVASGEKPRLDASPSVADIDLGGLAQAWTPSSAAVNKGAKTVLVATTGTSSSTIFSLDVTDPTATNYPIPMWELDLRKTLISGSTIGDWFQLSTLPADKQTSRHSPPIVQLQVDNITTAGKSAASAKRNVWTAIVASDYKPNNGAAGTVTLVDMSTGLPLQSGVGSTGPTGVVTLGTSALDLNEGVGGEPTAVDWDEDGLYDSIYVASTSGKIYRINVSDIDVSRGQGKKISSCVVANGPADLVALGVSAAQASLQRIHSNAAVRVGKNTSGTKVVQIFFGTGDNPDDPYDTQATNYYVMGYEDLDPFSTPDGAGNCLGNRVATTRLDAGQVVWGGIVMGKTDVYVATAVGAAADACNLSETQGGNLYTMPITGGAATSQPLGDHGINTPVIYDQHLFVMTAGGQVQAKGAGWNNSTGVSTTQKSHILMWEALPKSTLPK